MLKTLLFAISSIASALICGFSLTTLTAASLTLCAVSWINTLTAMRLQTGYVVNDPENYNPQLLSEALEKALCESLRTRENLILHLSNPGVNTLKIEITRSAELKVSDSHRSIRVENGSKWIPNHPLPLILYAGERSTLTLSPLIDGRVGVSILTSHIKSGFLYLLLPPLIIFLLIDINWAAAALTATIFHTLLTNRFQLNLTQKEINRQK